MKIVITTLNKNWNNNVLGVSFGEIFIIVILIILLIDIKDIPAIVKEIIIVKKKIQNQINMISKNNFSEILNFENDKDKTKKKDKDMKKNDE